MWGLSMFTFTPEFTRELTTLGWGVYPNPSAENEVILGDIAQGFRILRLPDQWQVAQRSTRGDPSLKLTTNCLEAAEKYIAHAVARVQRFREGLPDLTLSTRTEDVAAPYSLLDSPFECRLSWGECWADFGAGNSYAAVQFSQYAQDPLGSTA